MMFNKITLISLLLFFLLGSNVFAKFDGNPPSAEQTEVEVVNSGDTKLLTNTAESGSPPFIKYLFPGIMGFIIIAGFGSYWFIFRRKHV